MGGLRTDVERLTRLLPDPENQANGLVPVVTSYVDERGITQYTYTLQAVSPGLGQTKIQFQYNASNLGATGTADTVNVVSAWANFTRATNTVTLTIPTPSGGTTGLTFTAGVGSLTLGGTLAIVNGGTGQTTAPNAINALLPSQGSNSGKFLTTNGTVASWGTAGSSSPLTTKGDLYGHSTVDARIPIGSDGQILIADSTQALGLKWGSSLPVISTGAAWTVGIAGGPSIIAVQFDVGKIPANYAVTGWQLEMDRSGAFSVEVQKATSGAFPTYSTMSGTSTSAGGLPIIASGQSANSSNVSLWSSTSIGLGDSIRIIIKSNTAAPGWFSLMLLTSRTL